MTGDTVLELNDPKQNDPLQAVLWKGARKLLAAAIESEAAAFVKILKSFVTLAKYQENFQAWKCKLMQQQI